MSRIALVVGENEALRDEVRLALEGLGCEVRERATAAEALHVLTRPEPPALVVLDATARGAGHPELPRRMRDAAPATVAILVIDPEVAQDVVPASGSSDVHRFLVRPWAPEELRGELRSGLSRAALLEENRRLAALSEEQRDLLQEEHDRLSREVVDDGRQLLRIERSRPPPDRIATMGEAVLEAYDERLALHGRGVAATARDLARALGLPDDTVARIGMAGLLHDIGYVGLPRYLLARPRDRLTDRERADRDRHAEIGERLVRVDDDVADVARAIRHHHERFDGEGMPDGLRGEGIPLMARVVALADVHDRAYRSAAIAGASAARSRAHRALREARGKALDPGLVDAFLGGAALRSDQREIQVGVDDLCAGMVLTRDLRTAHDLFLAAGGTRLDHGHIERIQAFHRRNPILAEVFVLAG